MPTRAANVGVRRECRDPSAQWTAAPRPRRGGIVATYRNDAIPRPSARLALILLSTITSVACAEWTSIRSPDGYAPVVDSASPDATELTFHPDCLEAVFDVRLVRSDNLTPLTPGQDVFVRWFVDYPRGARNFKADGRRLPVFPDDLRAPTTTPAPSRHYVEMLASSAPFLTTDETGVDRPFRRVPPDARTTLRTWVLIYSDLEPCAAGPVCRRCRSETEGERE